MLISKKRKIWFIILCGICLLFSFSKPVLAIVSPTNSFYVNDYANLLSSSTKDYIIQMNQSLQSQTGAQIVVVTISSLEGEDLESYATNLFRSFGIGDKTKNNGLLLLISLEDRLSRVEVGYGLEGILPDAKTGRIQDQYMIPYLKENKWDEGILNGFNAFLEVLAQEYDITLQQQSPVVVKEENVIDYSILAITLTISTICSIFLRYKRKWSGKKKISYACIYSLLLGIAIFFITTSFYQVVIQIIFNFLLLCLFTFSNGIFFFGGPTNRRGGRGRRRIFLWWWFFWRRRIFWRWSEVPEIFKIVFFHIF